MTRDPAEIMTILAHQFPALKDAPGLDPWIPSTFDEWAASDLRGSGVRAVARFLFAVWNGDEKTWKVGGFRLHDLANMDDENLEVWKTWAARPTFL